MMPSCLRYPTDNRYVFVCPAPETTTSCCCPNPVRSTTANQSVFAFPSWLRFAGAYCATAARYCAALSMSGIRVTDEEDMLPLYSNRGGPCCPDFVFMITTPLAAFAP